MPDSCTQYKLPNSRCHRLRGILEDDGDASNRDHHRTTVTVLTTPTAIVSVTETTVEDETAVVTEQVTATSVELDTLTESDVVTSDGNLGCYRNRHRLGHHYGHR